MLLSLDIRDMLLIERLEIGFRPGLNVLTGETGAGKSILLDSLGFVLGWKGRADVVRQGAAEGEVTAVYDLAPDHPARAILSEAGLPAGDELVLRRTATADGRRSAFVNDRRAGVEVLRSLSATLVELHGQHDDDGLLNPRGHRRLLDAFAGSEVERVALRAAWVDLGAARRALAEAEEALAAARAEEDFLRHAVAELQRLSPEPGEDATLDQRRRLMQGAARIRTDIARAHQALSAEGAEGMMSDARRWLEGALDRAEGTLDAPLAALERALTELGEAADGVEAALDALTFDAAELERVEERLFAIRGLARKHDVAPDDLAATAGALAGRLAALDDGAGRIAGLSRAVKDAEAAYDAAAQALSDRRAKAARQLDRAMVAELPPLKLDRAVFRTALSPDTPGPEGRDAVQFLAATNPGAPEGPIDRVASGGELSRFLLALKVCLTASQTGLTLIFDEIDRGVGGATADAVGRRLSRLATGAQVLVVTHSPQVAARGAHHWRVEKRLRAGATLTHVAGLDDTARVEEIARMLAGDQITDAAREAARALMAG
jgi:DNA repair protein RecN (Recombination protein N)